MHLPTAQHEHGSLGADADGQGGDMHGDDDDEEDMLHDEGEEDDDDDDDDDDVIDDEILDASGRHDDDRDVALGVRRLQARLVLSRTLSHADIVPGMEPTTDSPVAMRGRSSEHSMPRIGCQCMEWSPWAWTNRTFVAHMLVALLTV